MRTLSFAVFMVVLPLPAQAQTDPAASSAPEAPAEAAPADAVESPPPQAADAAQAAPAVAPPPEPVAPNAPAPAPRAPIIAAPPPVGYAPQPSPLLSPSYGVPVSVAPPQTQYVPPPQTPYVPPPQTTYAPPSVYYLYAPPVAPAPPPAPRVEPPVSLPALPPGYVYMPMPLGTLAPRSPSATLQPGDVARREELYARLHDLDTRLDALQRARPGVGGPIALMAVGYGALLVSSAIAVSSANSAHEIKHGGYSYSHRLDYNRDGVLDHTDYRDFVRAGRIAGGVAAAGLLIGLGSTLRLFKNIATRRDQASELRALQDQRRNLRQQLDYGASFAPNQLELSVSGRF